MASSVPSSEDPGPYEDRRLHPRMSVALPAFLQANEKRHQVQIVDLSCGGAKLRCSVSFAVGTEVILDCGVLGRPGVIRWQEGPFAGLRFDSELDARDVSALTDRSTALAARMK